VPSFGIRNGNSYFHNWDTRIKIVSCVVFCFFDVSLSSFPPLLMALTWAVISSVISKVPMKVIGRRLKPVLGLIVIILILMPITAPVTANTRTIVLEPFVKMPISYDALLKGISIGIKAITVVLITTIILETSSYTMIISALQKIGVPTALAQMLLLSYRYIFVLTDEANRMHRAMKLRGFTPRTDTQTLKTTGQFLGTLFVRSFERIQRITDAMALRGYRGQFPGFHKFKAGIHDWSLAILWFAISTGLYFFDSLFAKM
jgi:cobalt/nickel transport system permease protein